MRQLTQFLILTDFSAMSSESPNNESYSILENQESPLYTAKFDYEPQGKPYSSDKFVKSQKNKLEVVLNK